MSQSKTNITPEVIDELKQGINKAAEIHEASYDKGTDSYAISVRDVSIKQ